MATTISAVYPVLNGALIGADIVSGGVVQVLPGSLPGIANGNVISSGGTLEQLGGIVTGNFVSSGGSLVVLANSAVSTTISTGGTETVSSGGS